MILDTNCFSAAAEGAPSLQPILGHATEAAVPVVVLGEFRYGIQHSRDRFSYVVGNLRVHRDYAVQFRIVLNRLAARQPWRIFQVVGRQEAQHPESHPAGAAF